jgi:hypothetical protein
MPPTEQFPLLVMIIRHGEKPGDPSNEDGGPDLSILGSARAAALPSLFIPSPLSGNVSQLTCKLAVGAESQFTGVYGSSKLPATESRFPTPSFLFATAPSNSSSRPVETITPLAQALQFFNNPTLTINDSFANDSNGISGLKAEILQKPNIYGGQVVLICWHHGTIPELTEAFGVPSNELPWTKWPSTTFDLIFYITWPSETSPNALLNIFAQQLLYGDVTNPPKSPTSSEA